MAAAQSWQVALGADPNNEKLAQALAASKAALAGEAAVDDTAESAADEAEQALPN